MKFAKNAKALDVSIFRNIVSKNGGGYFKVSSKSLCASSQLKFRFLSNSSLKRLALILLILCVALSAVAADQVLWTWGCEESVNYFRYQLNGQDLEGWTVVDGSVTSVQLETKGGDVLYVQSSYDGETWSNSGSHTFVLPDSESVDPVSPDSTGPANANGRPSKTRKNIKSTLAPRINLAPYALAVFDFYNGHDTASTRAVSRTVYGLSASVELDWTIANVIRIWPEASYALVIKTDPVIPGQKLVHYIKLGAGIEGLINLTKTDTLCIGLLGGALGSINNNIANITPYFGARLGYERALTGYLTLSVDSCFSMTFYKASQALEDSFTMLIEPVSVGLSYTLGGRK